MATEVIMPKLGTTMEEGEISSWHVEEGGEIKEGETLLEVVTDKANMEVDAPADGVLLKKLYEPGDIVAVTETIAVIGEENEDPDAFLEELGVEAEDESEQEEDFQPEDETEEVTFQAEDDAVVSDEKIKATPAARRAAREAEVDLAEITGAGPGGRIIEIDVEEHVKSQRVKATPVAENIAAERGVSLEAVASYTEGRVEKSDVLEYIEEQEKEAAAAVGEAAEEVEKEKLTGIKKSGAERVSTSWKEIPHVTLNTELDVSSSLEMIEKLDSSLEDNSLSITDFIVKVVGKALQDFPQVNAHLKGDEIIYSEKTNVGLAVDVEGKLMVPVIKNAGKKGLKEINADKNRLAEKAREYKLDEDQLSGSNITVTNLGMYEIDDFSPIINYPASCILGVGRIREKPAAVDGEIEIRPQMKLSLSFDHRLVNGAPAAQFLKHVKNMIEEPEKLML